MSNHLDGVTLLFFFFFLFRTYRADNGVPFYTPNLLHLTPVRIVCVCVCERINETVSVQFVFSAGDYDELVYRFKLTISGANC